MAGFMDSWNGFFGHAPGSTLMDRLSSPQTMGLLQAAAALQNGNQSFGQALSSGLGGFAQGAMMSGQMAQQKKRGQREDQQWELEQQKLQSEQARAAKVAEIQAKTARGEQLTPGDLFTLDPGAFAKQQIEGKKPRDGFTLGNVRYEYGDDGKPYIAAQGPRDPKEAPETWRPMQPEEAQAYGLPSPKGYRVSTRGQVQQIPGMGGSDEPMVEVYDPNSPTGTSYVPRSQASGRAGKPSNGITVGPDGTVQIGGSAGGRPPEGYRWSEDKTRLEPIPGGPKDPGANTGITTDQRNKLASARQAHASIVAGMDRLKELTTAPGAGMTASGATILPSDVNDRMRSAHTGILMEMKNLMELGVLNGNDQDLIERMIPDPTSWSSMTRNPMAGLDEARRYIDQKLQSAEQVYGGGGGSVVPVQTGQGKVPPSTSPTAQAGRPPGNNLYDGVPGAQPIPPPRPATDTSKEVDDLFMQFGM